MDEKKLYYAKKFEKIDFLDLIDANYVKLSRDYGNGILLCEFEVHALEYIVDNPGILISDIAHKWNYSLCAASKTISRLESKHLITKQKIGNNKKNIHLFPTEEGISLNEMHKEYDNKEHLKDLEKLLTQHTFEELDIFFNVLDTYIAQNNDYYRNSLNKNMLD